mmetsp:Transcript_6699/g.7312  ORF Transcript_6699/g.7312 Transcript_6699/m.7312 type:complete len:81 (-) Transcript_6699:543-785(-)
MKPKSITHIDNEQVTFETTFGSIVNTDKYNNELPTIIKPINKGEEAFTLLSRKLRGRNTAHTMFIQKNKTVITVTSNSVQ